MRIDDINEESLNNLTLKQKANIKERLESNSKIQKILYDYEKSKSTKEENIR